MIVGYAEEANAITTFLGQNLNAIDYPLVIDNEEIIGVNELDLWLKASVQPFDAKNLGLSTTQYRYYGMLYIQIFTKPNIGSGRCREVADVLTSLLRDVTIANSIKFKVPQFILIGVNDSWYQSNFSVEYYREEA